MTAKIIFIVWDYCLVLLINQDNSNRYLERQVNKLVALKTIIESVCFKKYVVVNGFVNSVLLWRANVVLHHVVTSWGETLVKEQELMDSGLLEAMHSKFVMSKFCMLWTCLPFLPGFWETCMIF